MTSLVQDAAMCTETRLPARNFASTKMNPEILQDIINAKNIDEREIISILFLMVDKNTDFSKVIAEIKEDPWTAFARLTNKKAWTDKLLESLILIGNKYVVGRMGFNQNEIQNIENVKEHNVSPHLNRAIKSLYLLCENLDENEVIKLISDVNNKLCKPVDIDHSKLCLELYILEWLNQKYISIDPVDLSNLVKNLKTTSCLVDLPFHFENWEIPSPSINKNEQDSQTYPRISNGESSSQYSNENSLVSKDSDIKWFNRDHKKLCIIINQIQFIDHKKRIGSEIDETSLLETFEGCDFDTAVYRDQTEKGMMNLLESLNDENKSYSMYGAIYICILSHGFEGEVVFSDDKSIKISTIREKFCCKRLERAFKFLILQSCQGKKIGLVEKVENNLVTDGPSNSINPMPHKHFCLFQATINDFAAMRYETKGSWFIQDLCQEIKEANKPLEIRQLIQNVTTRVTKRCAPYKGLLAVQVPESTTIITHPYEVPKYKSKIKKSSI